MRPPLCTQDGSYFHQQNRILDPLLLSLYTILDPNSMPLNLCLNLPLDHAIKACRFWITFQLSWFPEIALKRRSKVNSHVGGRMRVMLSSIGSRGDVQPILALALELGRWGTRPGCAWRPISKSGSSPSDWNVRRSDRT